MYALPEVVLTALVLLPVTITVSILRLIQSIAALATSTAKATSATMEPASLALQI